MSKDIKVYQELRKRIETETNINRFKMIIFQRVELNIINVKEMVGLIREGRAYGYLKARFPGGEIELSTPGQDAKGIDIIGIHKVCQVTEMQHGTIETKCWFERKTFQVGGKMVKDCNTDYYLQVTDKKIYMRKGDK